MKLLFLSDLHIDVNSHILKRNLLSDFVEHLNAQDYDYLIMTGDLSGDAKTTINLLNEIEFYTKKPIYYIPGNHDVWTEDNNPSASFDSYQLLANHHSSLIDKPLEIGEHVIIGDLGWYDYSFGPEYIFDKDEFKRKKKKFWNDDKYVKWNMSDGEFMNFMLDKFKPQLENFKNKKIIFLNHFVPFKDFISVKSDPKWNFCNAYMGSEKLGELINSYSNIECVVFGHTHKRFGFCSYREKNIICNPLGYFGEWDSDDFKNELKKVSVFYNI